MGTLKQKTPMVRKTPMARGAGLSAVKKPGVKLKPSRGPRMKKCENRACRHPFAPDPSQPFKTWCSPDCGAVLALDRVAKQKAKAAKAERAEAKRQRLAHPSQKERKKMESIAQALVNRVAVLRDWHDGCISCEKGPHWSGTWHGSHYKSVGSNSGLRYNLWNISKACSDCNWHRSGNIASYMPRLVMKFGQARLDWLNNHPRSREYTPEYLVRLCAVMRKKIRRMERRLGIGKRGAST